MTDIVERLRGKFLVGSVDDSLDPLLQEAADEIERLRAALEAVVEFYGWTGDGPLGEVGNKVRAAIRAKKVKP